MLSASNVQAVFQTLVHLVDWGNARDVGTLAASTFGKVVSAPDSPIWLNLIPELVHEKMNGIIKGIKKRADDTAGFHTT